VALQKVDEEICDLQNQILILQNLVNSLIPTTTTTSTSSTTTTTTTILCPSCTFYSVSNETITPAEITYYACGGVLTNAVVGSFGTIFICACTGTVVVPPLPGITLTNLGVCPTTTTTTSSSSTTTTTTTVAPVECFCYTINNPTEGSIFMTWTRCSDGVLLSQSVAPGGTFYRCSRTPVTGEGLVITGGINPCATDFDCIP
jgi:hypothetical protein